MSRKPVIGVMGAGEDARPDEVELADRLGELVAREGYVLLTGGRDAGVMAAVNVLSSDVVVAGGTFGAGTASEAALALKSRRPLVLLAPGTGGEAF